jgi:hypothetical protein
MDSEQKFTEGEKKTTLKFDVYVIEELDMYPDNIQEEVVRQLINHEEDLVSLNGLTQIVGGVVKGAVPFFFEIEYLKQEGEKAVYLDIIPIELDEYLDLITNQKTLTSNGTEGTTGRETQEDS